MNVLSRAVSHCCWVRVSRPFSKDVIVKGKSGPSPNPCHDFPERKQEFSEFFLDLWKTQFERTKSVTIDEEYQDELLMDPGERWSRAQCDGMRLVCRRKEVLVAGQTTTEEGPYQRVDGQNK